MNLRNTLLAILGGVALTTVIGILLTPYRDTSGRKKIVEKARDHTDTLEENIKVSVVNGKTRLQKMDESVNRMVNEGGNTV